MDAPKKTERKGARLNAAVTAWLLLLALQAPMAVAGNGPSECKDGVDNDGDGTTDYPSDAGCSSKTDNDEAGAPPTACNDGADNDGDGSTDYPADADCSSPEGTSEASPQPPSGNPCANGVDDDHDGFVDDADLGCMDRVADEWATYSGWFFCGGDFGLICTPTGWVAMYYAAEIQGN